MARNSDGLIAPGWRINKKEDEKESRTYNRLLPNTMPGTCAKFTAAGILLGSYGATTAVYGEYLGLGQSRTAGQTDSILVQRYPISGGQR
ncbi:hypothetical protein [Sphingobacterium sp. GVS05A]|uniref:hypothetical protein n=1 Tax=Sphingobacterium sp. GVS05A TaxID=2862679 RepID=UPI001CBC7E05|nr:hypothetical protein [Sphingobacterium sp. GVS05A]